MDTEVKDIIKVIEEQKRNCSFEVLSLDNKLIIFANQGSIEEIKETLDKKLKKKLNATLEVINLATAYVVPIMQR